MAGGGAVNDNSMTSDMVREARLDLFDVIEEISQATGLLRESYIEFDGNCEVGAVMCANDALEIVARIESELSLIGVRLAGWIEMFEKGEGE